MKISNAVPLVSFFILALFMAYITNLPEKPSFLPSLVGRNLEQFETTELNTGEKFSNADLQNNDIVVLNLFASWCITCQAEHPLINKLSEDGYEVYGIAVADKKEDTLKYLDKHGNPYKKIGIDMSRKVAIGLGATGVPETFILDKSGKIFFHQRGMIDEEIFTKQMLPILEGMKGKSNAE